MMTKAEARVAEAQDALEAARDVRWMAAREAWEAARKVAILEAALEAAIDALWEAKEAPWVAKAE